MTTDTNRANMRTVLDERAEARTFMDKVKASPRALREWVTATLKTLKIDAAAGVVVDAGKWGFAKLSPVFGLLRTLGLTNIAGVFATIPPARRFVVRAAATVYRVVTAPVRWLARGLSWGLSKFGFGRTVIQKVTETVERVETYVAGKVEQGISWMERNETHPAMKWARWFFQANIVRAGVKMLFPGLPAWAPYLASLVVPTLDYVDAEEAAIERAHVVLDAPVVAEKTRAQRTSEQIVADVSTQIIKGTQPGDLETAVLSDSNRPADAATFEAPTTVDERGQRRYRLGSQMLLAEDLPESISVIGILGGEPMEGMTEGSIEDQVRASQSSPNGKPVNLPRAAQRGSNGGPARKVATGRRRTK